jgi:hypothetical protein
MSSLVLADPTYALALAVKVCIFSTKRLVDLYRIYHENGTMPSIGNNENDLSATECVQQG